MPNRLVHNVCQPLPRKSSCAESPEKLFSLYLSIRRLKPSDYFMNYSMVVAGLYLPSPSFSSFGHSPANFRFPTPKNQTAQVIPVRPILTQSDRWIEKGDFRSKTKLCIPTQSKECLFDTIFFDRAIRSAHPVEKVDFFNGMHGSDCSIEKVFDAHRISYHPTKHTITPYLYNSSDAGLTATGAAAAYSESAWHILFSARQQRVPVVRWKQCVLSITFSQHRRCCCASFGDS